MTEPEFMFRWTEQNSYLDEEQNSYLDDGTEFIFR